VKPEPTKKDLDRVHKLILEVEEKRLLDDDVLDYCISLLNHFSVFHNLFGVCKDCDRIEMFWKMEERLKEVLKR